ncbi:MAG: glycosyltransferase family 39 protein, partial [Ruminococcus sp.]|nr:glycosyltransferase family 39 protein [Ruminococcus sp.]
TKGVVMLLMGFAIIIAVYYFANTKKYKEQLNMFMLLAASFMMKFYYVYLSSCYTRQHDVHGFGGESGHAGYMEYILFNHKLPDFDVREVWQYCHPPLHHIICALWIDINENLLGIGHNPARESLQTLTLFYSMCIVITAYRILKQFDLKGAALYIPMIIIAFHPAFIMFSGSINNDVLSVAFMMGAFLCTIRWYRGQDFIDLMKIALCVGLGMMTKLSAALVAPPIAVVFLIVFIKKIKEQGSAAAYNMITEFAVFGAVCVPLGLWFEIKNYVKYKVPITYVQEMPKNVTQFIGKQNFITRITDFSSKQFSSPFEQWLQVTESGERVGYNEYSPLVTLLKNSLYGEYINESNYGLSILPNSMMICKLFFWLGVVIAAVCFFLMIFNLSNKCGLTPTEKTFFGSFYAMLMLNFYNMAKDYPFTCRMNFRYITPTVIIGAFFLGLTIKNLSSDEGKAELAVKTITTSVALLFALLSIIIFVFVCLPQPPET